MHVLVAQSGPLAGRRFELGDEVILGRENATITLEDEQTSRRHAVIRVVAGAVVIEDLGSTNGTFVDGRRIEAATTLTGGETIRLGQASFSLEAEVEVAPEPVADAGTTRLADRPEPIADPERTALRPRRQAPEPPADPERTMLRSRPKAPDPPSPTPPAPVPARAAPAAPLPASPDPAGARTPRPARAPAPAPAASPAAAELPFGTFSPPAPKRRRGAASRKLAPTLVSFATIIATAAALIVYFAGR